MSTLRLSGRRTGAAAALLGLMLSAPPAWAEAPAVPPDQPTPGSGVVPPGPVIPTEPWHPDDKRRTLRSYRHNLFHNFAGFWSLENGRTIIATTALTLPAFAVDDDVVQYFADNPHEDFGRIGAKLGGTLAVASVTIGVFSAGRWSHNDRFRSASYDLSQAIIIDQVYTQVLKFAIQRERPDQSNNLSFPSGHSSNAFAMAAVAAHHYPRLAIPSYGVASLIAISRLAAAKHHFSDVVAGAGLGYGIGKVVVHRNGRPPDETNVPHVSVLPDRGPGGDGMGVRATVSF